MVDLVKMKRAIEIVESNAGFNSYPRFEVAFAPAGQRFTVQGHVINGTGKSWNGIVAVRWKKYGMASACSYGPAQILYHTAADMGMTSHPATLWTDPPIHDTFVNKRLTKIVGQGGDTVEKIADAWNSGNWRDNNVPYEYVAKVVAAYNR